MKTPMKTNKMPPKRKATKKQKILAAIGLALVAVVLVLFIVIGIPAIRNHKNSAYNSKYQYDGGSLVGKWQERDNFDDAFYKTYEFFSNGKVVTTYYVYGIEAIKDELSTYRIDDKNMLIITYTGENNVIDNTETRFSISNDKSTLVLKNGTNYTVLKRYSLEYNKDEQIYGEWAQIDAPQNVYTFKQDYTGTISDASVTNQTCYSTNGDTLYLFINENLFVQDYTLSKDFVIDCKYKIENDVLTLTIGDVTHSYERKK